MNYAASVGVTTISTRALSRRPIASPTAPRTKTITRCDCPFLEIYDQGKGIVRLRINFLHMETDEDTPELVQRLKNAFPFLGDDMVRTGGIGEFIAQGTTRDCPAVPRSGAQSRHGRLARRGALARPRATPTSPPPDFELEITAFETVNGEFPGVVRDKRWVVAHVPGITQEWINRFKAIGGGLSLTGWQFLAGTRRRPTVAPYAGPPFRMIVDSGRRPDGIHAGMSSDGMQIAPMNPWIHMYYATTGINAREVLINAGQQITRQEVLSLYTGRTAGSCARRTSSAASRTASSRTWSCSTATTSRCRTTT